MKFSQFIGNRRQLDSLISKADDGSLSHAYIISGEPGSGKLSLAMLLAKYICCKDKKTYPDYEICDKCAACKKINSGAHPDVHILSAAKGESSIKIDDLRAFLATCCLTPNEADMRIYIINDADKLRREAQNALLKSLEEPLPGTLFLLLTSLQGTLLPTVRSRCVTITLMPLENGDIRKYLREKYPADSTRIDDAVSASAGSIGSAINFMENSGDFVYMNIAVKFLTLICEGKRAAAALLLYSEPNNKPSNLIAIYSSLREIMKDIYLYEFGMQELKLCSESDFQIFAQRFTKAHALKIYGILSSEIAFVGNFNKSVSSTVFSASRVAACFC